MIDFSMTAEQKALRERVRDFILNRIVPLERDPRQGPHGPQDDFRRELNVLAEAQGLLAPHVGEAWGGLGLDHVSCAIVFEAAGYSPIGPIAMNISAPDEGNMHMLELIATDAQKERFLRRLAKGEIRSCFAMTEPAPGVGSDPRMIRTTATRDGDHWVINGHKWFASGTIGAAFTIVVARTAEGPSWFLVEAGTPGFTVVRNVESIDPFTIGGHPELRFEDCRVPADALIGEPGRGFDYAQLRLEGARLFHCMRHIGLASRALEFAQEYASRRESFGTRLAEHQQIQAMVADSHIDLYAARLMTADVARRLDAGESIRHFSSMAKVFVAEALGRVTDRAAQMMGALGMSLDSPVSMINLRIRPFRIYDGASEVHRSAIGKRIFSRAISP